MRVAFTIIYNGLHHLLHNNFMQFMVDNFDYWAVVEGHARNGGSTRWCKKIQVPARSTDGTHAVLTDLAAKNKNVLYYSPGYYWNSKDMQVNKALEMLRYKTYDAHLWQIDVDEQYTLEQLEQAEAHADKSRNIGFCFQFNHYLGCSAEGNKLIAKGEWGEGCLNRLWKWSGQIMRTHEPALLIGQRQVELIPDIRFQHYSYYFEQDVVFKDQYYGYKGLHDKWISIQKAKQFPLHISVLFGLHNSIGKSKSYIHELTN